jgi:tetratricopeptide (TPR) repeat protein
VAREQRLHPRVTLLLAVTGLLVLFHASARAQSVDLYLALAREYAAGRGNDATARLALWGRPDLTAAAVAASLTASVHDLLAAAMLHTDVANAIIDTEPETARFHINIAQRALIVAGERIGQRDRLEPFIRRWFRFVASVYTSSELLKEASEHVQRGLDRFPEDAGLYVARGIIVEVNVRKNLVHDWRRHTVYSADNRASVEAAMKAAMNDYLRALSIDSHNAEAHLHLGWVRFVLGDGREKGEFAAALADAENDTVRYLAHMFLGGLAVRENQLADALQEYELARAAGPDFQTPLVALSRVEQTLGHDSRARELALAALQLEKSSADDPWWDHRIGFDRESLYWLRDEVRRPR